MSSISQGDTVLCHIKGSTIVSTYDADYDTKYIFDVAALWNEGFLLYMPVDMALDNPIYITNENRAKYNTHKRFINSTVFFVSESKIVRICSKIDGMSCCECEEFYSMSVPNQEDGTLVCFSCRVYPHWSSSPEDD